MKEIEVNNIYYKDEEVDIFTIAKEEIEIESSTNIPPYSLLHQKR